MGLTDVLGIGVRGMAAAQLGLDVTGQNISNANTEGYSRKVLTLSADARMDQVFGQMGFGVEVESITRVRNSFLDEQIQNQLESKGYYEIINSALERVENTFTEPQDTGIGHYLDQFWNSWQDLANNPSDYGSRSVVQSNAQVLVDVLHNVAGELRGIRDSQNTLIESKVKRINEVIKEIYNLNQEIRSVEITSQKANDSRDQRDQLLKELSQYIDVNTIEDANGAITVTSGGFMLVSPVNFSQLEATTTTFQNADGTSRLDVGVAMADSHKVFTPIDGELKGLFTVRDETIPFYQNQLDELARVLVEKVNEIHESGYDLNGLTGTSFFNPQKTHATDIELSAAIKQSVLNIAAASGGTSIPDTTVLAAGSVAAIGTAYDLIGTSSGIQNQNIAQGTLTVTYDPLGTPVTLEEGAGKDYIVDYINGTITFLNPAYAPNAADIRVAYNHQVNGSKGPGDGSNALAIAQLRQRSTMSENHMGEATVTFGAFYGGIIGTLGIERNEADANVNSRDTLIRYLNKQQDSIAGVSLDEEMANMVKFQHAFSAAARIISVVDEMIQTLIQM